jgi:hypothetical protein
LIEVGSIVVTHNSNESLEFSTVVIQVSDDGARWYTLYDSAWDGTYVETSAGKEITTSYVAQAHDGSGAIKDTPSSAFFDPKIMIWDNDEKVRAYVCGELGARPSRIAYTDLPADFKFGIHSTQVVADSIESPSITASLLSATTGVINKVTGSIAQYDSVTASNLSTQSANVTDKLTVRNLVITGQMTGVDTGAGSASQIAEVKSQVAEVKSQVSGVQGQITGIQSQVAEVKSQVSGAQGQITALTNQMSAESAGFALMKDLLKGASTPIVVKSSDLGTVYFDDYNSVAPSIGELRGKTTTLNFFDQAGRPVASKSFSVRVSWTGSDYTGSYAGGSLPVSGIITCGVTTDSSGSGSLTVPTIATSNITVSDVVIDSCSIEIGHLI